MLEAPICIRVKADGTIPTKPKCAGIEPSLSNGCLWVLGVWRLVFAFS